MSRARPGFSRFMTIEEVAEILEVHERTIHRRIKAKELRAHKIGGVVRVSEEDLAAYLATCRE